MGLLATRWEGTYEGHNITVARSEVTRGFSLEWDGKEIAHRTWSWVGLGELHASAEREGGHHDVKATLSWGEGILTDGACTVTVDGKPVTMQHVR
jgi:hypothetical protein